MLTVISVTCLKESITTKCKEIQDVTRHKYVSQYMLLIKSNMWRNNVRRQYLESGTKLFDKKSNMLTNSRSVKNVSREQYKY